MTLYLSSRLDHRDDLGMRIQQFYLGKCMLASRKLLKAHVEQHQVIAGGGKALNLANAAYLTDPDGVSLPKTLAMARRMHTCLWLILDTLLGKDHPAAHSIDTLTKSIMDQETDLEE